MTVHAGEAGFARGVPGAVLVRVAPPLAVLMASVVMVGMVLVLGTWAAVMPAYAAALAAAVKAPRATMIVAAGVVVAVDPSIFGFTAALGSAVYQGPPGMLASLPVTLWPMELVMLTALVSLVLRGGMSRTGQPLPALVWGIPVVVGLGMAYGLYRGAELSLVYHEARGLIFGIVAFTVAATFDQRYRRLAFTTFMIASSVLSIIVVARYLVYVRWGDLPVPMEMAFAHESTIFLAMALAASAILILRGAKGWSRLGLLLLMVLCIAAIVATGRRAGTLVGLIGAISVLAFVFPRRPVLIACLSLVLLGVGGAYVGAYWHKEYGAIAQPARAIRSQFQPSVRDNSSDVYRSTEVFNLTQTIRGNRVLGIGFGHEFGRYMELPDLSHFWPLQFHTPHQNILWLWLKMGALGIVTCLALFVLAIRRCLSTMHHHVIRSSEWQVAAVVAASLLMYLAFATVDIVFPGTRGMVVLGILFALAFNLRDRPRDAEASV